MLNANNYYGTNKSFILIINKEIHNNFSEQLVYEIESEIDN